MTFAERGLLLCVLGVLLTVLTCWFLFLREARYETDKGHEILIKRISLTRELAQNCDNHYKKQEKKLNGKYNGKR